MGRSIPAILLAATPQSARRIVELIGSEARLVHVEAVEQAMQQAKAQDFDLAIVGYHFDSMRPWRLIQELRIDAKTARLPIVLVMALHVDIGKTSLDEIRTAYSGLGITGFVNLYEEETRAGQSAASQLLRDAISQSLRGTGLSPRK